MRVIVTSTFKAIWQTVLTLCLLDEFGFPA